MKNLAWERSGMGPTMIGERRHMLDRDHRPRILRVGDPDRRHTRAALEGSGNVVIECAGPNGTPCPLVVGDGCSLVDQATGIVFELDIDDAHHRAILRCYRDRPGPTTPIRLIAPPAQRKQHRRDLAGIPTVAGLDEAATFEFSAQVALYDMARRALRELNGNGPTANSQ